MNSRISVHLPSWFAGILSACFLFPCNAFPADELSVKNELDRLQQVQSGIERFFLDNGVTCLFRRDTTAPVASIQIWVGVGSIHEEEYLGAGLSHAVEHMIFKGTERRKAGDISREIDDVGGDVNAYTSFDRTVFHADLPARHWRVGLDVLADAVLHSTFPAEEWTREKDVILREIAMNNDEPDTIVSRLLWETAYRAHPYRLPVIGHASILKGITRDDLLAFCRRNYVTDNMLVVVVGDLQREEVRAGLQDMLGGIERRTRRAIVLPAEPAQAAARHIRKTGKHEVARLEWACHTVPLNHPDAAALEILAQVAGQGDSSRLQLRLRDKLRLVHSISAWSYTPKEPGLFGISAVFDPERKEAVTRAIEDEVASWLDDTFSAAEVAKAARMLVVQELAGLQTVKGQADKFAAGEFYAADPRFAETWIRRLAAVTPADVRAVARKYLGPDNRTLAVLAPEPAAADAAAVQPLQAGTSLPVRTLLGNGIPLIVREDHRLPFVSICVALRGGILSETATDSGITRLASELLVRGTPGRTAEEIARDIESRGASLEPFNGWNSFGLKGHCLAQDTRVLLATMVECLLKADFPEQELERRKVIQLAEIKQREEDPVYLAQKALGPVLFGEHPYGRDLLGTSNSVSSLTRDMVRQHYLRHLVASNIAVACFGDITTNTAAWLCNRAFAAVPAGALPSIGGVAAASALPGRTEQRIPKEQAVLLLGYRGISLSDPRYDAFRVLQDVMSGLSSDLAMEVRETRGLAYYVGAYQRVGIEPGSFVFYAGTRPDAVATVEDLMRKQVDRIISTGIRQDELDRARNRLIAQHEMSLQSDMDTAMNCALNEIYGLGYDYGYGTAKRLEAVTVDRIKEAAAGIFRKERSAVSVVLPEQSTAPSAKENKQ